ncbi:hypothetical protein LEP3755_01730 [Leptolyngbya sp. NIES-3755]|nr:hypothetical protein LEP3755_01730 [Leptolyngbya sp. NIES-3755]
MLDLALVESGSFRLVYLRKHIGNKELAKIRAPMIEMIELPITIASRVLIVSAVHIAAKPSWRVAGTLFQEVAGVGVNAAATYGFGPAGTAVVDVSRRTILLNSTELHIFPKLATEHRYRFEAVRWLPDVTLGVWEYIGPETDTTEELLQTVKVDLVRVENKINILMNS